MFILFGFGLVILRLYFYKKQLIYLLEWEFFKDSTVEFKFILIIDWISLSFISVVLLIRAIVLLYRKEYIREDKSIIRFLILTIIFIISMIIIILRPRIVSILLGWDGLGLTSFCLVIYYQNIKSYLARVLTIIINRVGDIILLLSITLILINGRFNIITYTVEDWILVLFLLIVGMTKRAQIPFSSWLPAAIAAPTPISALVHSSTLVTAGVYIIIRFENILFCEVVVKVIVFPLFLITIFMARLRAVFENDLKKIIALSTLRQLGFIIVTLLAVGGIYSYFHLLIHAIFKSLIFICGGYIIHKIKNYQDIRNLGGFTNLRPIILIGINIANFSLRGIFFLTGYFSKDIIIEIILVSKINLIIVVIVVISITFRVIYSFRVIFYLFIRIWKFNGLIRNDLDNKFINFPIIFMRMVSIFMGAIYRWNLFSHLPTIIIKEEIKIIILIIVIVGLILRICIFKYKFIIFSKIWILFYSFIVMIWGLKELFCNKSDIIFILSEFYYFNIEKGWNEFLGMKFLIFLVNFLTKAWIDSVLFEKTITEFIYFLTLTVSYCMNI